MIDFQEIDGLLRLDGFRSGLDDEKLAGYAVLGPLHIHRLLFPRPLRVVSLDGQRITSKFQYLVVAETEALPFTLWHLYIAGQDVGSAATVDHFDALLAKLFTDDWAVSRAQGRFEDVKIVGIDRSLHDVFSEPVSATDEDHIAETGLRIEAKHDTARRQVRADHFHHPDGEGDLEVVEPLVDPVGDGPVGEKGGKAAAAGIQELC